MPLQLVIQNSDIGLAADLLPEIWGEIEVFQVESTYTGISMPTKVVDQIGEMAINQRLCRIPHFNLWEGRWIEPSGSNGEGL